MNGISRETFVEMDQASRDAVLFDLMKDVNGSLGIHCGKIETVDKKIDSLDKKVERRKKFDTTVSAGAGFVGGAVVMLFRGLFGK